MTIKPAQQIFSNSESATQWVVKKHWSWVSEESSCAVVLLSFVNNFANWKVIWSGFYQRSYWSINVRRIPYSTPMLRDVTAHAFHWLELTKEIWVSAKLGRLIKSPFVSSSKQVKATCCSIHHSSQCHPQLNAPWNYPPGMCRYNLVNHDKDQREDNFESSLLC